MAPRPQRTLARSATVCGFGLFGGQDVTLEFLPAPPNHGLAFQRVDLPHAPRIPALISYVQPRPRRTALGRGEVVVETTEHVLAALAGLEIDNCLIRLDAPEPPAGDGSAIEFVEALLYAGIVDLPLPRRCLRIEHEESVEIPGSRGRVDIAPSPEPGLTIRCDIDYSGTTIGRQISQATITSDYFREEIAPARTFILDSEVAGLKAQGFGQRVTTDNVLVFGPAGPIDNDLHAPDECARHKILDVIGDLALLGCDIQGRVHARQSGHALNHEVARRLAHKLRTRIATRAVG